MSSSVETINPNIVSGVIIDLEGTLCSISFVKETLFPYATKNVSEFLAKKWDADEVQEAIEGMRLQSEKDTEGKVEGAVLIPNKDASKEDQIKGVSENMKWLISIDNKGTFMKKLSGLIWEEGYSSGNIKGHIYEDVKPAIEGWKESGKKIYIYSSGSVQAQQLLLKYSAAGDLQPLIDGYFDTKVGNKQESLSYKNILENISIPSDKVVFLTDIVKEADAAKEAGIKAILLIREGNAPLTNEDKENFQTASSFTEISFDSASSKRKTTTEDEDLPPAKIVKKDEPAKEEVPVPKAEEKIENGDKNGDVEMKAVEEKVDEPLTEKTEDLKETVEKMETDSAETEAPAVIVETEKSEIVEEKGKEDELVIEKTDKKEAEAAETVVEKEKTEEKEQIKPSEETKDAESVAEEKTADEKLEEKLDELLGEKGVELEKECDDILSKVDSLIKTDVKTKVLVDEKPEVVNESASEIKDTVETPESATEQTTIVETPESASEKTTPVETLESAADKTTPVETAESALEETTPVETPKPALEAKEVTETNGKESESTESNGVHKEVKENGNEDHAKNGTNGAELNGKETNGESKKEDLEKTNGDNGEAVKSDEAVETEIKVKKIVTEEAAAESVPEQAVEA